MYENDKEKDKIKKSLSIEQVFDYVADLGGEPQMGNGYFIAQTICHNPAGEGSHKLFYYENTRLFKCFTECEGGAFDIFDLTTRVKKIQGIGHQSKNENGETIITEWTLYDSIVFVANYFNIPISKKKPQGFAGLYMTLPDWDILRRYDEIHEEDPQKVELKHYNDIVLKYFPKPHIEPWEQEGITYEVEQECGIAYDPCSLGIIIPHFDINGDLIGIRERTLVREQENYGKYKPALIGGQMYNHPLGFSVYNLNNSKDNIRRMKKIIVFEAEKSCLKYRSFFGKENDISCAVCGSNLTQYQFKLILSLGVDEIIIGFDRQFKEIGDAEYLRWINKLEAIAKKYCSFCNFSFLFDTKNLLHYKDSPIDQGPDVFKILFKERLDRYGR